MSLKRAFLSERSRLPGGRIRKQVPPKEKKTSETCRIPVSLFLRDRRSFFLFSVFLFFCLSFIYVNGRFGDLVSLVSLSAHLSKGKAVVCLGWPIVFSKEIVELRPSDTF